MAFVNEYHGFTDISVNLDAVVRMRCYRIGPLVGGLDTGLVLQIRFVLDTRLVVALKRLQLIGLIYSICNTCMNDVTTSFEAFNARFL